MKFIKLQRWFAHLFRMQEDKCVGKVTYLVPVTSRPKTRPGKIWIETVEKEQRKYKLPATSQKQKRMLIDRRRRQIPHRIVEPRRRDINY